MNASGEVLIPETLTLTVSLRGTREVRDNSQVFRLAGLLDAFSEPTFRKVVDKYIEEGPSSVILDMSQIDFIDSSGIGALVQVAKKVQQASGKLQLIANSRVMQTIKMVRLEQFFKIQPNVEAALENAKRS
ncbi:STAS domain-containing protein [Leptolyngbya sp. O-77]|uniref:STAS domain-containing protein n=1 Tax=Leptolyngbya sp. O-77 TaxID=1080068 RepID=UPI001CEC54A4|nr:STAS domain-containing protein [Leptolyngbya sp. O-77]